MVYICCCFLLIGYRIWLLVCLWGELLDLFVLFICGCLFMVSAICVIGGTLDLVGFVD